MTQYGISDPKALQYASSLSKRAALGYFILMLIFDFAKLSGHEMVAPAVFAMIFSYLFLSLALLTSGRQRMLTVNLQEKPFGHIPTITFLVAGSILFIISIIMLIYMVGFILMVIYAAP